jgi:hypothetical protein
MFQLILIFWNRFICYGYGFQVCILEHGFQVFFWKEPQLYLQYLISNLYSVLVIKFVYARTNFKLIIWNGLQVYNLERTSSL